MAIIEKKDYRYRNGGIEYIVVIWEKIYTVCTFEDEIIYIANDFKNECPKCQTPYNEPKHGDSLVCPICYAQFEFFGACHPKPINQTLYEVEDAIGWR
jgi:hypothetical protein